MRNAIHQKLPRGLEGNYSSPFFFRSNQIVISGVPSASPPVTGGNGIFGVPMENNLLRPRQEDVGR